MFRQNHIVQKHVVEVLKRTSGNAFSFKDQLSDFCLTKLLPAMEEFFDLRIPADRILWADKIVIDAGELPDNNWEEVLVERVIDQLHNCVTDVTRCQEQGSNRNNHGFFPNGKNAPADVRETENQLQEIDVFENTRRSIHHFLQTGVLPWYAAIKNQTDLNEKILALLSDDDFFGRLVMRMQQQPRVFDRIIYQLNEHVLQAIITNFGLEIDLVRSLQAFLVEIFVRMKFSNTNAKHMAYHVLLKSALQKNGQPFKHQSGWSQYVDDVLAFTFKRFVTAGIDRIIPMLNESAFVAFREKSLKSIADVKQQVVPPMEESHSMSPGLTGAKAFNHKGIQSSDTSLYITNAGLVLLHPFLPMLFENLGYIHNKEWASVGHHQRAVVLTQFLASGQEEYPEFDLVLNKVLTGFVIEDSLPADISLSDFEKQEATDVLKSVIKHWTALRNTTIQGLQSAFLMREGKLDLYEAKWNLLVEYKTMDILMNRVPWSFSIIKTPWMKKKLNVEWIK